MKVIALKSTTPVLATVVPVAPVVKVAVPSGVAADVQLAESFQLVGSPASAPVQVPSTAWAAVVPSAVLASRAAVASRGMRARLGAVRAKPTGNCEALRPKMLIAESTRYPG